MNVGVIIAVLVFLCLFIVTFRTERSEQFLDTDYSSWPATFTWDWQGGHGRDRYDIMSDSGPFYSGPCYNRNEGPVYRDC